MSKPSIVHTLKRMGFSALAILLLAQFSFAQPANEPQREQLLNGLDILFWPRSGSPDVLLKMRIHSGAAFDLSGKAGEMALLGDLLFPDPATADFFSTEMGGRLGVSVNYDSIVITMSGKAEEFEQIVQVLRNALLSTQLTPEVVTRVKDARMKVLRDTAVSAATVADRAIGTRLFGDFPYGRPAGGSLEDLARVERADLMLARERFLNSNNATLAVVGGVTKQRALRTLRQLLGPWRKNERVIPTTFRQPIPADAKTLIVNSPDQSAEVRLAVRGLSRSDADVFTAGVLARLAQHRWLALAPDLSNKPIFARSDSYVLPGLFLVGGSVNTEKTADSLALIRKVIDSLVATPPTPAELEKAKLEVIADVSSLASKPESLPDPWFDMETYRLSSLQNHVASLQSVTAADIQRVATRLFKDAPVATVVVGDSLLLKTSLQGKVPFEVFGEITRPTSTPPAPSPKPQASPTSPPRTERPR